MKKDYERVCKVVPEFAEHTLQEFMRIRTLINSRIFGTVINGVEDDSIIPFADMFNYTWQTDMTKWGYDNIKQVFSVVSKEEVERGKEVYVSYGHKPNFSFFLYYGFVVENNVNSFAQLNVYLDSDDKLKHIKDKLLDFEACPRRCKIGWSPINRRFYKLMSYLRFVEYEGDEEFLIKFKADYQAAEGKKSGFKAQNVKAISLANEEKVLKSLRILCKDALKDYPTTLEEDLELLKDQKLTFNQRNCIIYRAEEKEILKFYVEFADKVLKWLKGVFL